MRLAAMADLHYTRTSRGSLDDLFRRASREADVLLLCGDLTDYGLPEEAEMLVDDLRESVEVPVVAVLGNHDYESARQDEVKEVLTHGGLFVLDGDACELDGVGFAGAKGFAGGFGSGLLAPWGEPMIKAFVQEGVEEALKLESALRRLKTERRVVLLHYAPIAATVVGEPPEIFPYLGCSRLEEPLDRYPVDLILHGHAHRGTAEGRTAGGIPVYNVSVPVLRKQYPDRPPLRFLEVGVPVPSEA
jgi:Icc-related predicted phosphoesterase